MNEVHVQLDEAIDEQLMHQKSLNQTMRECLAKPMDQKLESDLHCNKGVVVISREVDYQNIKENNYFAGFKKSPTKISVDSSLSMKDIVKIKDSEEQWKGYAQLAKKMKLTDASVGISSLKLGHEEVSGLLGRGEEPKAGKISTYNPKKLQEQLMQCKKQPKMDQHQKTQQALAGRMRFDSVQTRLTKQQLVPLTLNRALVRAERAAHVSSDPIVLGPPRPGAVLCCFRREGPGPEARPVTARLVEQPVGQVWGPDPDWPDTGPTGGT
jgi:hypothetical protein